MSQPAMTDLMARRLTGEATISDALDSQVRVLVEERGHVPARAGVVRRGRSRRP
ncbi:hypothetical protein ACWCQW_48760 [Streptomyces mirabilis]